MEQHYYHLFANGDDAKNFITSEEEFRAAFNRFAVCAYLSNVTVLAASVEDSHPHALFYGSIEDASLFKNNYENFSNRYISRHRGSLEDVSLHCEIVEITDISYLMNVAIYVIIQATKDGKAVLPYDYLYGTGALYFRKPGAILPWDHDYLGHLYERRKLGDLPVRAQWKICNTKIPMPADWITVNGFIHPLSFVDVAAFEKIHKTHNCFRAFLASGKARDEIILKTMASTRGVTLDDIEARNLCKTMCYELFEKLSTSVLSIGQRITLAQGLRKKYMLSIRQLSFLTKISENELRKYVR